jgi:acyl-CoA synthetase (AMP-forming)/AMP-acid ligase II
VRDHARTGRMAAHPIVPILGEPSFHQIACYLGVLGAGAIPALIPPMSDDGLAATIARVDADLAFVEPPSLARARGAGIPSALPSDVPLTAELHAPQASPAGVALIHYTSGSTSAPRGVMLSADGVRFNTNAILAAVPLASDDSAMLTMPIYYCFGLSVLHTHLVAGASIVLSGTGFTGSVAQLARETSTTMIPGVPSLFAAMLRQGGGDLTRLEALRHVMISGGKLASASLRTLIDAVPHARVNVRYGITETTAAASFLPPERLGDKLGSVGRGLAGAPLSLRREDGSIVAPGESDQGEIWVRGRHVALGYLGDPSETAAQFINGAYRTGDRARVDADGFFFIEGREKSFVKTAGHRVAVEEVEEVLLADPRVHEAGVSGVPDQIRGEALVALVVARAGHALTTRELATRCAAALPAFKVPLRFHFAAALPRTSTGKIDRRALLAVIVAQEQTSKPPPS